MEKIAVSLLLFMKSGHKFRPKHPFLLPLGLYEFTMKCCHFISRKRQHLFHIKRYDFKQNHLGLKRSMTKKENKKIKLDFLQKGTKSCLYMVQGNFKRK